MSISDFDFNINEIFKRIRKEHLKNIIIKDLTKILEIIPIGNYVFREPLIMEIEGVKHMIETSDLGDIQIESELISHLDYISDLNNQILTLQNTPENEMYFLLFDNVYIIFKDMILNYKKMV